MESKPILVVRFPMDTPQEIMYQANLNIRKDEALMKDYHAFVALGDVTGVEFKVLNSPYSEEEFKRLEDLIKYLKQSNEKSN